MISVRRPLLFLFALTLGVSALAAEPQASSKVAAAATAARTGAATEEKPLRLGCVAWAREASTESARHLQKYLQSALGGSVVLTVYPSYHDVIADLVTDQLELAVLTPLVYLNARQQKHLDTLAFGVYAATGKFTYRGLILVPGGSPVKTVADLAGKRMAFVDIMSASGYVLPKAALVKAGVKDAKDVKGKFYDNHVDAVGAMLRGDADAAATYDMIFADSPDVAAKKGDIRTLWTSEQVVPSDAVVATEAVPAATQKRIRTALLSYFAAQQTGTAQKDSIYEGFVPADLNLYCDLERFVKELTGGK